MEDDRRRWAAEVGLALSIALSAFVMALALSSTRAGWLTYLALMPLFVAIARCAPVRAAVCGALWGVCLYALGTYVLTTGLSGNLGCLVLLTVAPATYAFLGAWLTRRIGFSPLVLGVGWMGVELALSPLGLRAGLLAGTQIDSLLGHVVGGAFGYVVAAFVVAYVSAFILSVLGRVRLSVSCLLPVTRPDGYVRRLAPQVLAISFLCADAQRQPRAPPRVLAG